MWAAGPTTFIAVDVNGDGKPDLVAADQGGTTLTVLTNNGSGVFGLNATLNVGANPSSVCAADVNGDGKVDLICANYGGGSGNTLTVLTNNGSGVFGFNATVTVGGGAYWVIAADVNGDGKPDLICANYNAGTISVLTNNGSGAFGSNATLVVAGASSVAAADVNGDGSVDLIASSYSANTLTVFTNNESGVFGSNATLNGGSGTVFVMALDVNGDGRPDLITADVYNFNLSLLLNEPTLSTGVLPGFQGNFDAIGGGQGNSVSNGTRWATVAGGENNIGGTNYAVIGGGDGNNAGAIAATVAGGAGNANGGNYGTIAGGQNNVISNGVGIYGTVGGGNGNNVGAYAGTNGGGRASAKFRQRRERNCGRRRAQRSASWATARLLPAAGLTEPTSATISERHGFSGRGSAASATPTAEFMGPLEADILIRTPAFTRRWAAASRIPSAATAERSLQKPAKHR